jgi:probable rRNA maturation factor
LVIVHKALEGVSGTMLARFLNRGRRTLKLDGEVTLLLASSAELRRLNREFRGQDYATDVLSFPSEIPPQQRQKRRSRETRAGYAGDIAISADIARRNGRLLGHGVAIEIKTLILHGLLHLAGYDHESDHGRMARQEVRLRGSLGLPEGLIERTNSDRSRRAKHQPARPGEFAVLAGSPTSPLLACWGCLAAAGVRSDEPHVRLRARPAAWCADAGFLRRPALP